MQSKILKYLRCTAVLSLVFVLTIYSNAETINVMADATMVNEENKQNETETSKEDIDDITPIKDEITPLAGISAVTASMLSSDYNVSLTDTESIKVGDSMEEATANPYDMEYYDDASTMYADANVNLRTEPDATSDNVIDTVSIATSLEVTGDNGEWYEVNYEGETAYVSADYVTTNDLNETTKTSSDWNGEVLNSYDGRNNGPMGAETYYNLSMGGCIQLMGYLGYSGDYWVRDDGVKMWDEYVMVAADLSKYPKGTIVDTSLGKGIVVDTGDFVHNGSGVTFDIATEWD